MGLISGVDIAATLPARLTHSHFEQVLPSSQYQASGGPDPINNFSPGLVCQTESYQRERSNHFTRTKCRFRFGVLSLCWRLV
jgi:hypothetical protein